MTKDLNQILTEYIEELLDSPPRIHIPRLNEVIRLNNVCFITRKSLKYISHARKNDGYTREKILRMIICSAQVIESPYISMPNHNPNYPNSRISIGISSDRDMLLVVHMSKNNKIFNAFYRPKRKLSNLLKKQV